MAPGSRQGKGSSHNLQVLNPRSAGVDIGSRFHVAAVSPDLASDPVRRFDSFTTNLREMVEWFATCGVTTVAMESTGIYWIPLFELLISAGIDAVLVNARYAKNVPGRKSDINDAQWLQRLHSYGLLRASFMPDEQLAALRSYVRQRDMLVRRRASHIQHAQKALMQMNLQLHHVVADIMGVTGRSIIDAILGGERDPDKLAILRDRRCKNSAFTIAAALDGNYQEEHLFELRVAIEMFDAYSEQIQASEQMIQERLGALAQEGGEDQCSHSCGAEPTDRGKQLTRARKRSCSFDPRPLIQSMDCHRILEIPGLGPSSLLTIISECGLDMTKWPSAKHFTSWLGLAPHNKISGGKLLSSSTNRGARQAASAFWTAALVLSRTSTALGAFHRRVAIRIGKAKAVVATARKLATIYYQVLRYGVSGKDPGVEAYKASQQQRLMTGLKHRAKQLGMRLVPLEKTLSMTGVS
ncbi:MAG: IS110 family transposase [Hylemonella sp.]|jgi:transposase